MMKTISQRKRRHVLGWLAISLFVANLIVVTPATVSAQATKQEKVGKGGNSTREACPNVPKNWRDGKPSNPIRAYDCYCKKPTGKNASDKNPQCVIDVKNFRPIESKVFQHFIDKIPDNQCPHIKKIQTQQDLEKLARCKMTKAMTPGSKKMEKIRVIDQDGYVCKSKNNDLISSNPKTKKPQSCLGNFHTIFYHGGSLEQSFTQTSVYFHNEINNMIYRVGYRLSFIRAPL